MYDSTNSEWVNGEIKLGTKTAFSIPINLASKTGSGLVQTFFTYTADNDQFLNIITTGTTDCGSNEAYISLSKNGTEVERYTLITNTATTHNFAQLNLMEGDTITLKFGWVNNHGAKLNGTANFLSIVGNPRLQPIIYSTTEREIGVWVDGKPLYEKTFVFTTATSVSANSWGDTPISNDGIDKTIYCVAYDMATGTSYDYLACGPGSGSYVRILNTRNAALSFDGLTLRYTKSTDTAGSGKWTPQGVPAVHYSGSEQVIGTWIDGSTLYQKTIEFACSSTNTTTTYTMDAGVNIKGYDTRGSWAVRSNHNILSFNCIVSGSASYSACLSFGTDNGDNNTVVVRHQQKDITNAVVTVIYTKNS